MESITLNVLRGWSIRGTDRFDVLSDYGTGSLDTVSPINKQSISFWSNTGIAPRQYYQGHLTGFHGDVVSPTGLADGVHLIDEHLRPAAIVSFITPRLYFGAIHFAIRVVDANGTIGETSEAISFVANSSPRPVYSFEQATLNAGILTFAYEPAPDFG